MTPLAAKWGYGKCSSYLTGYLETTSIGMNIEKQIILTVISSFKKKSWLLINGLSEAIFKLRLRKKL